MMLLGFSNQPTPPPFSLGRRRNVSYHWFFFLGSVSGPKVLNHFHILGACGTLGGGGAVVGLCGGCIYREGKGGSSNNNSTEFSLLARV